MSDNKKSFFKVYCKSLKDLWNLSRNEMRVFLYLCSLMKFGSGCIILDKGLRQYLSSNLSIKMKTFYNIITSLKKKGLVSSSDDVYYYINQEFCEKG